MTTKTRRAWLCGWVPRVGLAAALPVLVGAAEARELHRHYHRPALTPGSHIPDSHKGADPDTRVPIPYAYSFYPHEIEGGVSGNLPFNNQIRKFRDPLNANGAGG